MNACNGTKLLRHMFKKELLFQVPLSNATYGAGLVPLRPKCRQPVCYINLINVNKHRYVNRHIYVNKHTYANKHIYVSKHMLVNPPVYVNKQTYANKHIHVCVYININFNVYINFECQERTPLTDWFYKQLAVLSPLQAKKWWVHAGYSYLNTLKIFNFRFLSPKPLNPC